MAIRSSSIQKTQKWVLVASVALLSLCVIHSMTGGYALGGEGSWKAWLYAGIMGCVTVMAALLPAIADRTIRQRQFVRGLLALTACALLTGGEIWANMLAMGSTREVSIVGADHADRRVADRRATIADTEASIRGLEASIKQRADGAGWLSTKPAAAWRSDIANAEGHALYARSRQCSQVTLPDSRAHCDRLAEARANLAVAEAHEADASQLAKLRAKLSEVRDAARNDAPGVSAARTQTDDAVRVASWVRGVDTRREDAEFAMKMFFMLVLVFGPMAGFWAYNLDWSERPARPSLASRIGNAIAAVNRWRRGPIDEEPDIIVTAPPAPRPAPPQIRTITVADSLRQMARA